MKNINFTDWQDLWLKKDVEGISKKINAFPVFNVAVLFDVIIAILTLAVGMISVLIEDNKFIPLIISFAVLAIIVPLVLILVERYRKYRKTKKEFDTDSLPVKEYIDIFDNKICTCIMMANTLCDNIAESNRDEENCYYVSETSYYINKCIAELSDMKSMTEKIFINGKDDGKKKDNIGIAAERLLLVVNLIKSLREEIDRKMKKLDVSHEGIKEYFTEENNEYNERLNKFIDIYNINNKGKKVTLPNI